MEIEHSETIRPLVEAPFFESSDSPPLFIAYMREVGGAMLSYLTPSRPDAESVRITASRSEMTIDELKTQGAVNMATIETLRAVGREILNRNIDTFIVTRQIKPLTKNRAERRKRRKDDSEESDNAFALSKGWLTVPQAAKRFPFTEGAIRHMIFQAEAYVRVKKRPSKASLTKKKPHVPDGFLDVIVRIPNKRRVFLDEKKFAAWMAQSQGV